MITFGANIHIDPSPVNKDVAKEILRRKGYKPKDDGTSLTVQVADEKASGAVDQIRELMQVKHPLFNNSNVTWVGFGNGQKSEASIVMRILMGLGLMDENGQWIDRRRAPGRSRQHYVNKATQQARKQNPNLSRSKPDQS